MGGATFHWRRAPSFWDFVGTPDTVGEFPDKLLDNPDSPRSLRAPIPLGRPGPGRRAAPESGRPVGARARFD